MADKQPEITLSHPPPVDLNWRFLWFSRGLGDLMIYQAGSEEVR